MEDTNGKYRSAPTEVPYASQAPDEVEVAVVGAGPAGLTVAAMLAGYGVRVAVLDGASGPAEHSRAAVVHARTLEALDPLGVVDEALREGVIVGHFGVRDRDRRLLAVDFDGLPTPHPYTLMLPQDDTEGLLRGALRRRGGEIAWEHEVVGVRQDAGGVELKIRAPRGEEWVRAKHVVACDGAHSSVRDAVEIPFEGETYPQSFVLADVRMGWALPDDEVQLFFSPEGLVVVAPLPGGSHRLVATVDEASAEPSLNDVQELLDTRGPRTSRTRVEEVVWSSRFRVAHKVAARFREGGVFLCGDAAHVHSPAGGQGMNTGIQDAANLAWKLAVVLRGHADEGAAGALLDSYEAERRQVALGVVSTAHRLTRLATVRSPVARRLRNALLAVAGLTGPLPRRLAANLAEVDIVYRGGWSADGSNAVGRWIPEGGMAAAENQDTASGPAFGLVVPEGHEAQVLDAAARFPGLAVRVVPVPGVAEASLVRPDGYVAGRGGAGDGARLLGLLARALGITPHGSGAGAAVTSGRAQLPHPSGRAARSETGGTL
jgi:2-polyprenyl-6-methoxyphenol hydroxylase-like FAD-dependent oxidoreductase